MLPTFKKIRGWQATRLSQKDFYAVKVGQKGHKIQSIDKNLTSKNLS